MLNVSPGLFLTGNLSDGDYDKKEEYLDELEGYKDRNKANQRLMLSLRPTAGRGQ